MRSPAAQLGRHTATAIVALSRFEVFVSVSSSIASMSAAGWWGARRRRYNLALVAAGLVAFMCYLGALQVWCAETPGVEVTLFTTLFQGVGYLFAIGMANVCYFLGPGLERFVEPALRPRYRRWAFRAGLAFSVALPFAIPLLILARGCVPSEP
jgi:hypothetical protein